MSFSPKDFIVVIGVLIGLLFLYRLSDRWIKRLSPATAKRFNQAGFAAGVVGGILWYMLHHGVFMLVTLAGILVYFLFYNYDKMEEEGNGGGNP